MCYSYINYSNIAAKLLRQALKPELRADAMKRADAHLKVTKWADGKAISKYIFQKANSWSSIYDKKFFGNTSHWH